MILSLTAEEFELLVTAVTLYNNDYAVPRGLGTDENLLSLVQKIYKEKDNND